MKKSIEIICPCFNESKNIPHIYKAISNNIKSIKDVNFEISFIDNASTDSSVEKIKEIMKNDKRVSLVVNAKNFGHLRSPMNAFIKSKADAVILIAADFEDPPELIPKLVKYWKEGYTSVVGIKNETYESFVFKNIRKFYYKFLNKISDESLINDFMGYGIYDQLIVNYMKELKDPYPYLRGIVPQITDNIKKISYKKGIRRFGVTKNNFMTLYDIAILGLVTSSKLPLRIMIFTGIFIAFVSFCLMIYFLVMKLLYWDTYPLGIAPIILITLFFSSINFFFLGLLGEYLLRVLSFVERKPYVVEQYRSKK